MQLFERKKSEKSPNTRSDAGEPKNFHVAGIGQPNTASAKDKKGFATGIAACGSKVSQTS